MGLGYEKVKKVNCHILPHIYINCVCLNFAHAYILARLHSRLWFDTLCCAIDRLTLGHTSSATQLFPNRPTQKH